MAARGLLLAALVAWVHHAVGGRSLLAPWRDLPPSHLLGLLALAALSYVLRAVRAYDALRSLVRGRFLTMLRVTVLHTAATTCCRCGSARRPSRSWSGATSGCA